MFRKIETEVSPILINAFRTSIGAITFILFGLILNLCNVISQFTNELTLLLIISIVFGQVVGDTAYFITQMRLGTTISLAISMTFPFFTFFISILILKNPVPVRFLISSMLIALGILIMHNYKISIDTDSKKTSVVLLGDLREKTFAIIMGIIAAFSWALGIVFTEISVNEISYIIGSDTNSSLVANAFRFPFASLCLILLSYNEDRSFFRKIREWNRVIIAWLFFASILGTSIGALLYVEAIRIAGAAFVSILWTASPLFALPITWWLNAEQIGRKGFLGVIITIIGAILSIQ